MDFGVSNEMSTMLEMIREFMDREVIPLEGEMLHGDPATLEAGVKAAPVSYTHLRAHETVLDLVCRLLLEKKKTQTPPTPPNSSLTILAHLSLDYPI